MKQRALYVLALATLILPACDMYTASVITPEKMQVSESQEHKDVLLTDVDDVYLSTLSQNYLRYGEGALDVTVTYDPSSGSNTASKAQSALSHLVKNMKAHGMSDVHGDVLPVYQQGDQSHVMIAYTSYEAHAPADCGQMPGMESNDLERDPDYKFGCSMDSLIAKQVANPRDLLGRDSNDANTDGRRAANIVDTYRTGTPNKDMQGEQASQ